MYIGPFFYLNHPRINQKGLFADLLPDAQAKTRGHKRVSPVTHADLLDRIALHEMLQEIPRGSVVYDLDSRMAVIYIDRCIEKHLGEIIRLFELTEWVVEYDDQFVCPRCDHLTNRF